MNEATMTEPATANPASAGIPTGRDAPRMGGAPVNGVPMDGMPRGESPINGASANGESANGAPMDGVPMGESPIDDAPADGVSVNGAPTLEPPKGKKWADTDLAVPLTEEEWAEQPRLFEEYSAAIARQDREKEAEILPKLIWPASLLKAEKRLMGANYIRKKGYNTADADLVYGPGWLDEDDGGPTSDFSPDYKPLGRYELPRSWRDRP